MKAKIGMQLKCPKTLIYSAFFPLFLGCQTTGVVPDAGDHLSVSVEEKVVQLVSDSVVSIESHMRSLRQMDFARDPVVPRVTQVPLSGRIAEKVDLRWTGPAEAVLRAIAGEIEYQFVVNGVEPATDLVVIFDHRDTSFYRILEDIGWQLDERATVIVDRNQKILQISYRD